jgi:hypothetical protein
MSTSALDRGRLAKLLGMLGSEHDGEALAAARQVERLRTEAGLTWAEISTMSRRPPTRSSSCSTMNMS